MVFILEDKMAVKFNANEARKLSFKNDNKITHLILKIKEAATKGLCFISVERISTKQKILLEDLGFSIGYSNDGCYTIEW